MVPRFRNHSMSAEISTITRAPLQHAAYEKLRELSRRNGKDIREHHLESHAIDVAIALEIGTPPVTVDAIMDRVRVVFGMSIKPKRTLADLDYTSGRSGEVAKPWIVLDKDNRVTRLNESRYPRVTQEIVAFLEKAATRKEPIQKVPPAMAHSSSLSVAGVAESSPLADSETIDAVIEDAALGGIEGMQRLLSRRTSRRLTRKELELARQRASDVGRQGEEFIDRYFAQDLSRGQIESYEWVSDDNAISPFDFVLTSAGERRKIEVKATSRDFKQMLHISLAELLEMRDSDERYDLYRVYALDGNQGSLRIAEDTGKFAARILDAVTGLPDGVTIDGVSLRPDRIAFGKEMVIGLTPNKAVSNWNA